MENPRAESVIKSHRGETDIRLPRKGGDSLPNHIDHYAVLSQVINAGVTAFLHDQPTLLAVQGIRRHFDLDTAIEKSLNEAIIDTFESRQFSRHRMSLEASQSRRYELGLSYSIDVGTDIKNGVGTSINTFSNIYSILSSRINPEVAAHPDNWHLSDRIAKLSLRALTIYSATYLGRHENWSHFIEQTRIAPHGAVQFVSGYPWDAKVSHPFMNGEKGFRDPSIFKLDDSQPLIRLRDTSEYNSKIGCPVTFKNKNLSGLWRVYANQSYRIDTVPPNVSLGDSEASAQ